MPTEAPTAPAPATPAPSPAPAAPTQPAAAPASPQASFTPDSGDPFSAMDARIIAKRTKAPEPKPDEGRQADPEKKPDDAKAAPSPEGRVFAPKDLRQQFERTNSELKQSKETISSLEAKIKDFDARGKDTTALTDRLTAIEKERDTLQSEIRALKQEASPEFKDKYDKPFNQASEYAKRLIEELQVGDFGENAETGAREWKAARQATWEDFVSLYRLPVSKASAMARQMFGEDSGIVIGQMTRLKEMDAQRQSALTEEKAQWKEKETQSQAEAARRREQWQKDSGDAEKRLRERQPEWYGEDPNDPDGNEMLKEGERILNYQPKTWQEAANLAARHKMMIVGFPRLASQREMLRSENAELKAQIEELKGGSPGRVRRATTGHEPKSAETWQDQVRKEMEKV